MRIGGRHIMMRPRWLAVLSLAQMAAVYILWTLLYSPVGGATGDRVQAQCASFDPHLYAYAQCAKFATQVADNRQTDVAQTAALISILSDVFLWLFWADARFFQVCRSPECGKRISRYGVMGHRR